MTLNPYESAKGLIKPGFSKDKFRIFVLGPSLQPTDVVAKPSMKPTSHETVLQHAKYLRYATKIALQAKGFSVDFGETQEMLKFWESHFGTPDPGSAELHQADRMSGAIVVYPSSVGSLCELSMFSLQKNISAKTLAIVHKLYENDQSFFRRALLEVLEQENGKFAFKDYAKHQDCIQEALRFVEGKYQSLLRDHRNIELLNHKYRGTAFQ